MTTSFLTPWSGFFVMTASSAAALTGLMFVVITLVTGTERRQRSSDGISMFSTPTVVHFCLALFVSAILCAPWPAPVYPGAIVGLTALYELTYIFRIAFRAKRMTAYTPDAEDWTWYSILPVVAYGAILGGAIGLEFFPRDALFALGAGVLLLIFIGIRNAWDVVTFLAIGGNEPD